MKFVCVCVCVFCSSAWAEKYTVKNEQAKRELWTGFICYDYGLYQGLYITFR